MIAYLNGLLTEKNPAYIIVECKGVGYFVNISLNTYSQLPDNGEVKVHTHLIIREDSNTLYGFFTVEEKNLFGQLISVSGVGPNTARMILSSLTTNEVKGAIVNNDASVLQNVKGIGAKSAQRIVVDLKDKLEKEGVVKDEKLSATNNTIKEEALSALVMLGFVKNSAQKTINNILKNGESYSVEELVKLALKSL